MKPDIATTVTIQRATEADIPSLVQNESNAFDASDPPDARPNLGEIMFGPPTEDRQERRVKDLLEKMHTLPEARFFKAVVADNGKEKIVGFALWHCYTDPIPVEDTWKDLAWEGAANPAACNEFIGGMARVRTKNMGGKRFLNFLANTVYSKCPVIDNPGLDILTVDPDFQRMGIGSQLIRAGFDEGARHGLDESYVESSPAGYGLYRKWGFEAVDTFPMDLRKYGGNMVEQAVCMIRKASGW